MRRPTVETISLLMLGYGSVGAAGGLPITFNAETGENVSWVAKLGSESYGGPTIHAGRVFVGTNNQSPRDPRVSGDRGVLMAFAAADGAFLWQAIHTKHPGGEENDWPLQGVCSTPTAHEDRIYYVSNRGELMALDVEGFRDGENDGPFVDEAQTGRQDADIVWSLDMPARLGVVPRHMSTSSPAVSGDRLFVQTSNGPDAEGRVPAPAAPSFLAVERSTGNVIWTDASPGSGLIEGQWSSPTVAFLGGEERVFFPAGDGRLYAFTRDGRLVFSFDGNRGLAEERRLRHAFVARAAVWHERIFIAMGRDPEAGSLPGALWALDGSPRGDITATATLWSLGGKSFSRSISTVALLPGSDADSALVFAADLNGFLLCLEALTGEELWRHDAYAAIWSSPLVADGKVYIADEEGDLAVLRAARQKELLAETNLGAAVYGSPVTDGTTLYVTTRENLYALRQAAP
jgi:outer membrane protein assembly factor BamB